jgi:hypothetical protein
MKQTQNEENGHDENDNNLSEHLLSLSEFHKHYQVIFIDPSGYLNLCSNMNSTTFLRVKHEANLAIEFLNNQFIDSFDVLFMKKMKFIHSFDLVMNLTDENEGIFDKILELNKTKDRLIDYYNNPLYLALNSIEKYICQALDNRLLISFTKLIDNSEVGASYRLFSLVF